MKTPRRMTFDQWKRANRELVEEVEIEHGGSECEHCCGTGLHDCDCGRLHTCGYCDGTGRTPEDVLMGLYKEQRSRDELALQRWISSMEAA
jgi:DnaJ-class molecular chaperone